MLKNLAGFALCLVCLWVIAASVAWRWRHPRGNRTTFVRHLPTAMQFGTVGRYR